MIVLYFGINFEVSKASVAFLESWNNNTSFQNKCIYVQIKYLYSSGKLNIYSVVRVSIIPVVFCICLMSWIKFGRSRWLLNFWDCGFESRRGHGCVSFVCVVCCHVEVTTTGRSLVQRNPTDCVCVCGKVQQDASASSVST
jgi:hypothetical protein